MDKLSENLKSIEQDTQSPSGPKPSPLSILFLPIAIISIIVVVAIFGYLGFVLGNSTLVGLPESTDPKLSLETAEEIAQPTNMPKISPSPTPSPTPSTTPTPSATPRPADVQPISECLSAFTSRHLKLSFTFNSCLWEIFEDLVIPNQGIYSKIWAKHIKSGLLLQADANNIGMGGGYPGCTSSDDIKLLDNNMARVRIKNSSYYYLTSSNKFGIRYGLGDNGDIQFQKIAEILELGENPMENICWISSGMNLIDKSIATPEREYYENQVDFHLSIEEPTTDTEFLSDSDELAQTVMSAVNPDSVIESDKFNEDQQ